MKILLKEFITPNTDTLNDSQKAVLLITYIATSPEIAFANTTKSENLATARDILIRIKYLIINDERLELTMAGTHMLTYYNLIDNDKVTDNGEILLQNMDELKDSYKSQPIKEKFEFLASLLS
jgi:hypothetical protein